jgi:hypothetical protein
MNNPAIRRFSSCYMDSRENRRGRRFRLLQCTAGEAACLPRHRHAPLAVFTLPLAPGRADARVARSRRCPRSLLPCICLLNTSQLATVFLLLSSRCRRAPSPRRPNSPSLLALTPIARTRSSASSLRVR